MCKGKGDSKVSKAFNENFSVKENYMMSYISLLKEILDTGEVVKEEREKYGRLFLRLLATLNF